MKNKNKTEIWVKGYVDKDGDIIISLGNDGYHRVLKDYVDLGIVEVKEVWQHCAIIFS